MTLAMLGLAACGGDDGEDASTSPTPSETQAPSGSAAPPAPSGDAALPPELVKCMAEQGYEVSLFPDLNSLPQEAVQPCAELIH